MDNKFYKHYKKIPGKEKAKKTIEEFRNYQEKVTLSSVNGF